MRVCGLIRLKFPLMVRAVPDILAEIIEQKKIELLNREPDIEARADQAVNSRRDFKAALLSQHISVIAEIKKASPSKGVISQSFHPAATAQAYQRGGAVALSVLTDRQYFQGSLADLNEARAAVNLPVLRKDFTIDEYHVLEAAAHGADAILLIAAVLNVTQLRRFRELAEKYRMAAVVEVHDEDDLSLAIDSGASVIGVNNRNLKTFEVNLETALNLAARIPADTIRIAESGIHSRADIQSLESAGYRGFLVGEHLMRSGNPERALQALLS